MFDSEGSLDWVLILAPYRRDAEYLRTLFNEHRIGVREADGADALACQLPEEPGLLVVTHEALNPAVIEAIAKYLADQPSWSEVPIIILLDRAAPHARIRAELSLAWPRSRQIFYQRPVATLELLSGVQSALLARLRQRDVRDHIEREVELRRELNHRVKNILASVTAMFEMTRRDTQSADQLAEDFSSRLRALSAVHSAIFAAGGDFIDLKEVIQHTCMPYGGNGKSRIVFDGPSLEVGRDAGTTLALCVHELATNALKYGALSTPEGKVRLCWTLLSEGEQVLRIEWRERGGPPVAEPSRLGYGTRYIRSALRGLFGSPPQILFEPEGLRCVAVGYLPRLQ